MDKKEEFLKDLPDNMREFMEGLLGGVVSNYSEKEPVITDKIESMGDYIVKNFTLEGMQTLGIMLMNHSMQEMKINTVIASVENFEFVCQLMAKEEIK